MSIFAILSESVHASRRVGRFRQNDKKDWLCQKSDPIEDAMVSIKTMKIK